MQDRQKLLSFVVVGGGPTGVEVAAELHDMIRDDLVKVGAAPVRMHLTWRTRLQLAQSCVPCLYLALLSCLYSSTQSNGGLRLLPVTETS